jgi:hypothetical protein
MFGGCGFQYTVDMPMGTNYLSVGTDPFFKPYELNIKLELLKSRSYKCTIHYIDEVFTLNNYKFDIIYPIELEIKDTTDITRSTSCLDLHTHRQ